MSPGVSGTSRESLGDFRQFAIDESVGLANPKFACAWRIATVLIWAASKDKGMFRFNPHRR